MIPPDEYGYYKNSKRNDITDREVFVSLNTYPENKNAFLFKNIQFGQVLHLHSLPGVHSKNWTGEPSATSSTSLPVSHLDVPVLPPSSGLDSVLPADSVYTKNIGSKEHCIGIKNHASCKISVYVLSAGSNAKRKTIFPGEAEYFLRSSSQLALVSLGSCSGAPRAYLARTGHTLHIYSRNHVVEPSLEPMGGPSGESGHGHQILMDTKAPRYE